MKRVRVSVGPTPYDVIVGRGVLAGPYLRRLVGRGTAGALVSSEKVMSLHGARVEAALDRAGFRTSAVVLLHDGEAAKTTREWERALRAMARAGLDRGAFVIAFGGGSVGDAAGFAAATYMRGIRLVHIPTTLLSMVDSSVGGKTGINLSEGKNLVGSFHQPSLVLADTALLRTLPSRERQSGIYEILKCGLLRDEALLRLIEHTHGLRQPSDRDLETAIAKAVRIKARIVEGDEKESGERILLNLGHTLGHALEAATSYRVFTHGEAVGYGMDFAVDLGERLGITKAGAARRMRSAIAAVGRRTPLNTAMVPGARRAALGDKKRNGAILREILLAGPQQPVVHAANALELSDLAGAWITARCHRHPRP